MGRQRMLLGLLCVATMGGCGGNGTPDRCGVTVSTVCRDSFVAELQLATDERVNNVSYEVTGNGIEPITGWINTSAPNATASAWVAGLPTGNNYNVQMTALTIGGDRSCQGSAQLDIVEPDDGTELPGCEGSQFAGSEPTNGNTCASLDSAVVAPLQTANGQLIDVQVSATDADDDTVRFRWTATGGFFYYVYERDTRFECFEPRDETITIEVSDDNFDKCIDRRTVNVRCANQTPP